MRILLISALAIIMIASKIEHDKQSNLILDLQKDNFLKKETNDSLIIKLIKCQQK